MTERDQAAELETPTNNGEALYAHVILCLALYML